MDSGAPYGLTGAIIATDRAAIVQAQQRLRFAAGNFYINDKPTGAVVGQQPFGGARASGTNDKAGSVLNLQRWVSPRAIKETFVGPTSVGYPHQAPDRPAAERPDWTLSDGPAPAAAAGRGPFVPAARGRRGSRLTRPVVNRFVAGADGDRRAAGDRRTG